MSSASPLRITGMYLYPVKSMRGISVTGADLDEMGLEGDRQFMVVGPDNRFITQRSHPQLALISTAITADRLVLSARSHGSWSVDRKADEPASSRRVSVWSSYDLLAEDCGDETATWLGNVLGIECRLVRTGRAFRRPVNKPGKSREGDLVSFADAYPLLVISTASLADLNDRLIGRGEQAVPMDRFRPNIVVDGCSPFAEDTWRRLRINGLTFRAGGPCARCVVTTTDQETGERGVEPLRTLAGYRRDAGDPTDVNFGQNFFHEDKSGRIECGALVEAEV